MGGRKVSEEERREQLLAAAYRVAVKDGLEAVTARSVATAASTSHGLVFFHFGSVHGMLVALLDRLLDGALDAEVTPDLAALPPAARLNRMLRIELEGIPEQRDSIELFFAYWLRREPEFRERIDQALERYRRTFEEVISEMADADSDDAGVLASVVVSFIQGAAVQAVRGSGSFDARRFIGALERLVALCN